jgi:hypothetical protein
MLMTRKGGLIEAAELKKVQANGCESSQREFPYSRTLSRNAHY